MIALLLALMAIAPTPADFAWRASIAPSASGGLRWIVWTDSVYLLSLRPDHGDVALFTNEGKVLPWSGIDATGRRLAHLELPLKQLPSQRHKYHATKEVDTVSVPDRWIAEIPASSRGLWTVGARLDLGTRNRKPFLGKVVLETSVDLDSWKRAGGGGICQIGSLADPIVRDSVELNGPLERYLRVSIVSNTPLAVRSLEVAVSGDSLFASAPTRSFREVEGRSETGAWEYDLGGDFPVDRLALAVGPQSILDARILAHTTDDTVWTEIVRSSFFQVEFQGHRLETPPVELSGSSFRYWRIVQVSGTLSQPPRLRVEWTPLRRIFLAGPGQEVDLAVGSRRLTSADPGFSENLFSEVASQSRQNLFNASEVAPLGFHRIGTGQPDATPDRRRWILALLVVAASTTIWFAWKVWKESTSGGTLGR